MKSIVLGAALGLASTAVAWKDDRYDRYDYRPYCGPYQVIYKGECRDCVAGPNRVLPHAIHNAPGVKDECRCPASFEYNFDAKECQCTEMYVYDNYYKVCVPK